MIDKLAKQIFEDINEKITSINPENSRAASQLKAIVESNLRKLNLVTREEFDAQQAVLMKTREKLDELEKIVTELENR